MARNWHHGNAAEDGVETRGWLLGHFIDPAEDVRSTSDLEVKWAYHAAGEQRHEWTADDQRTTMVLLVSGHFRLHLTEGVVDLSAQGDYAVWGPGIDHLWEALAESTVITIRWPSQP